MYEIKNLIIVALASLSTILTAQNVVSFSSDEGFTNEALYNQSNWDASFSTGTWMVNADSGNVSVSTDWKRAAWKQGFSVSGVGKSITFRVNLNFTGTLEAQNNPLIKIGFSSSSDVGTSNPPSNTVFLSTLSGNDEFPDGALLLKNNTNAQNLSPDTYVSLASVQGSGGVTDDLALLVTLTLGNDAASSTISATLLNLADNTESITGSYTGIDESVYSAATTNIYGYFHSQSFSSGTQLTSINVESVEMYTSVDIYPSVKRFLGTSSSLDRSKFFNLHSGGGNDIANSFFTNYNANEHGRRFWGPGAYAVQQEGQVGSYPTAGSGNSDVREVTRYVGTEHPYNMYEEGIDTLALSNWVVEYFKNFADVSSRPEYYEPMNEPFVHARDYYSEPDWDPIAEARVKLEMAHVFKAIGNRINETPELANMKVIGYAAAYPSFERNDFSHWSNNMKMFMDEAGIEMDGFSTHLYDGINQVGQDTKRSGSNLEAVLDLIESYSFEKWNIVKPHIISEFGGIVGSDYTDETTFDINNAQSIRSQNAMLFSLLERQSHTELSIPFTTGKSTWHITAANNYMPYKAVLFKPVPFGVPLENVTSWAYTDRIYFYDLWKNVTGDRILIRSNNPDVQTQAFRDGNKLYIAMNNLDDFTQNINLNFDNVFGSSINDVRIKSVIVNPNETLQFSDQTYTAIPSQYQLAPNETIVLEYNYDTNFEFNSTITSNRYYDDVVVQEIIANNPINYNFSSVTTSTAGYATLRVSIGRKHDKSKSPTIVFNGSNLNIPTNWKGYDQTNRDDFFGMIEINVPNELVNESNTVSIAFPDSGGHISSVVLINETFTTPQIEITKTGAVLQNDAGNTTIDIGDQITYDIVVTNTGNTSLTDVSITDTLTDLDNGPLSLDNPPVFDSSTDINSSFPATPTLKVGEAVTFKATFTVTQEEIDAGGVSNSASVTANDPQNNSISDSTDNAVENVIVQSPSISVNKTASVGHMQDTEDETTTGDTINYTITVSNTGNVTLSDISITDLLTDGNNQTLSLTTPNSFASFNLAPGVTEIIQASYIIEQPAADSGSVNNTASVNATAPDNTTVSDAMSSPVVTITTLTPQIEITKTGAVLQNDAGNTTIDIGDQITYDIVVTNTGNTSLTDVSITDTLTDLDNGPLSLDNPPVFDSSTDINSSFPATPTLKVGEAVTFKATFTVTQEEIDAGGVSNSASVTANDPQNNSISDSTDNAVENVIVQSPSISVNKTASVGHMQDTEDETTTGDTINYTITVSNTGNVTLSDISITDLLTDGNNQTLSLTTPNSFASFNLAPGVTEIIQASYIIEQPAADSGSVNNTASVNATAPDNTTVSDAMSSPVVTVMVTLSNDAFQSSKPNKLILQPNPTSGFVYLINVEVGEIVNVFDLTGKKVFHTSYNGRFIDLANFRKGVYIVSTNKQFAKLILE